MSAWALTQRMLALVALVALAPLIGALGLAVRTSSPGPALHRAVRVGPTGTFTLYKLRTMEIRSVSEGSGITAAEDPRITRLGKLLRRTKLDELPQLWNVVRGDMLLVGPRPEDPRYVDRGNPVHAYVLSVPPGITGPASLAYRSEESMLGTAAGDLARAEGRLRPSESDIERAYRHQILPAKIEIDADYLRHRTWRSDAAILVRTIGLMISRTSRLDSGP